MSKAEELKLLDAWAKSYSAFKDWKDYKENIVLAYFLNNSFNKTAKIEHIKDLERFVSIAIEQQQKAVSLARKEERKKHNSFSSMLPDKHTSEFESDGIKFFPESRFKEVEAHVQEECEAKRLPINWRSNKEVIDLVNLEKQETAKKIFKVLDQIDEEQDGLLSSLNKYVETKNRFFSKLQSGKGDES